MLLKEVTYHFVVNELHLIEPPRLPFTFAISLWFGWNLGIQPSFDESLVIEVEFSEVDPMLFVVEPDVRHDNALVVDMVRRVLVNHAHDTADELDIRR